MLGYTKLKLHQKHAGGGTSRPWYRSRRQTTKSAQAGGSATLPTVAEVVDHDCLLEVFDRMRREKGQAPGRDGLGYRDLGHGEIAQAARALEACVVDGSYQPFDFRSVFLRKKFGGRRELRLRNILDRLVATALYERTRGYWETVFVPRSYGFRPGNGLKWTTGVWPLLADLILTVKETGLTVLAVDDVEKAFDNLDLQILLSFHAQHVPDAALLALVEKVLRGGDAAKVRGIDQGSAYSPAALNLFLHHAHDRVLDTDPTHPLWWRYADNLLYLSRSVPEALHLLGGVRHLLGEARLTLKGQDGPPVDLNEEKARLLGLTLFRKGQDVTPGLGEDALENLRQHLGEAHETANPPATARAVIRGWVAAHGPAFGKLTDGDILANVLKAAVDHGFRETFSQETLTRLAGDARKAWDACLKRAAARRPAAAAPVPA